MSGLPPDTLTRRDCRPTPPHIGTFVVAPFRWPSVAIRSNLMSDATTMPESSSPTSETNGNAERVFSKSVAISGIRCTLTYLIFPFVAPLIGITSSVGAVIGVLIGVVAIVFNIMSIRRLFAANHPYKWWAGAMNASVIVLLIVLFVVDSQTLLG